MAQQPKLTYEGTFNHPSTGLFKANTTGDIGADDAQTLVTNTKDSVPFTLDDSYTWPFPQVTASGTDTYAATLSPVITAYATGQKFQIKFTNPSSTVCTLNLNALGAKKIFINPTTQATTGHIVANQISLLAYDATLDSGTGGFLMLGSATDTSGFATISYVDGLVLGLLDDRGNFDASGGAYPSSGGSGTAGAILKGDLWRISVAGTLPTGVVVQVGDAIRALVDTPGNTQANWAVLEGAVPDASDTTKGIARLYPSTSLGTNTDGAPTQNAVKTYVDTQVAGTGNIGALLYLYNNFI